MYERILTETFPRFLSIRDSQQKIIYLNDNFSEWIKRYTEVDPVGKTNIELAALVPKNVADTFMQCHDASLSLQSEYPSKSGLKKIIEFKSKTEDPKESRFFDTLKYWVILEGEPNIFTIAYDVTELYMENLNNYFSSFIDSLTKVYNRRYIELKHNILIGHYASILDLDNFKTINNREGHFVGDEFLLIFSSDATEEMVSQNIDKARYLYQNLYKRYRYLSIS